MIGLREKTSDTLPRSFRDNPVFLDGDLALFSKKKSVLASETDVLGTQPPK